MRGLVGAIVLLLAGCSVPAGPEAEPLVTEEGRAAALHEEATGKTQVIGFVDVTWAGPSEGTLAFEVGEGQTELAWSGWGRNVTAQQNVRIHLEGCPDGVQPLAGGFGLMGGAGWTHDWCNDLPPGHYEARVTMETGVILGRFCVLAVASGDPAFLCSET